MTAKRYFKREWEEEYYIFDSQTISENEFDEKVEYEDYQAFADSMSGDEVVELLNELHEKNKQLKQKVDFYKYFQKDARELEKELNELHEENQALKKKLEFFNELNKPYGTIIEENKRLKSFISRLTNDCGEIVLMNGIGYNVKKIFGDLE